jgi:hypothetical protein
MGHAAKTTMVAVLCGAPSTTVSGAQVLETETARLRPAGSVTTGGGFEWQTSSEGKEWAVPFALEFSLTDRVELLVEPVAGTAILPKVGRHARGLDDLEATVSCLARQETPAILSRASFSADSTSTPMCHTR